MDSLYDPGHESQHGESDDRVAQYARFLLTGSHAVFLVCVKAAAVLPKKCLSKVLPKSGHFCVGEIIFLLQQGGTTRVAGALKRVLL